MDLGARRPKLNGWHFADILHLNWSFCNRFSWWSSWQEASMGADNGLAPNGQQTIAWINHNPVRCRIHYSDVIMNAMAPQITGVWIVYSTVHSGADQRKHQSTASLAIVRGIHLGPVNSPHKGSITRKMFPFDDVIMHMRLPEPRFVTEISYTGMGIRT